MAYLYIEHKITGFSQEDTGQMSSQLDEQMLQYIEKEAEQGRTA